GFRGTHRLQAVRRYRSSRVGRRKTGGPWRRWLPGWHASAGTRVEEVPHVAVSPGRGAPSSTRPTRLSAVPRADWGGQSSRQEPPTGGPAAPPRRGGGGGSEAPPDDHRGRGGTPAGRGERAAAPPLGERWSTWDRAEHGPAPRPEWVITELAAVDDDLGVLKS